MISFKKKKSASKSPYVSLLPSAFSWMWSGHDYPVCFSQPWVTYWVKCPFETQCRRSRPFSLYSSSNTLAIKPFIARENRLPEFMQANRQDPQNFSMSYCPRKWFPSSARFQQCSFHWKKRYFLISPRNASAIPYKNHHQGLIIMWNSDTPFPDSVLCMGAGSVTITATSTFLKLLWQDFLDWWVLIS